MARRIPQRRPVARPIGNKMTVRQRIDDQTYELTDGSRVGQPVIGYYSGGRALLPGEQVIGTWREAERIWDIAGIARAEGVGVAGVFAIGGPEFTPSAPILFLRFASTGGVVNDIEVAPTVLPSEDQIDNVRFSPDGQFLAVITEFAPTLSVYTHVAGKLPSLIDSITLDDGAANIDQFGLSWHPDGDLIAVGHDDATGDSISIFSFDGSTLTLVHSEADPGAATGCMAAEWHADGVHLAAGYTGADVTVFSWNGSTLTSVDTATAIGAGTLQLRWSPSGDFLLEGIASDPRVRVLPWSGTVLGTPVNAGVAPPASTSFGVAWYPQEDRIITVNNNDGVTGYPWTGSAFGARVLYTAVTRFRRDVAVDPTGEYFVTGIHGAIDPDDPTYGESFTFDGSTIIRVQEFGHPRETADDEMRGYSVDFAPSGAILPTEQLDASAITYTPDDGTDWVDPDPEQVKDALDVLAARVTALEP